MNRNRSAHFCQSASRTQWDSFCRYRRRGLDHGGRAEHSGQRLWSHTLDGRPPPGRKDIGASESAATPEVMVRMRVVWGVVCSDNASGNAKKEKNTTEQEDRERENDIIPPLAPPFVQQLLRSRSDTNWNKQSESPCWSVWWWKIKISSRVLSYLYFIRFIRVSLQDDTTWLPPINHSISL